MADNTRKDPTRLVFQDEAGFGPDSVETEWNYNHIPTRQAIAAENDEWTRLAVGAFECEGYHPELAWGGLKLHWQTAFNHFAVSGPPGAGKTITIRLLLQSVASMMGSGRGVRALAIDSKGDMRPILEGIVESYGLDPDIIISLYPFGHKPDSWDLAHEIGDDVPTAFTVANAFVPQVSSGERFFRESAQTLVAAVFIALQRLKKDRWDLRDVCLAFQSEADLAKILTKATPGHASTTATTADQLLGQDQMTRGILAELRNAFARLEPVAAIWHGAPEARHFTTSIFFEDEFFLLLGTTPMYLEVLRPLNQILLRRLTDVALSRPELDPRRDTEQSFFVFDELSYLSGLAPIRHLLTLGRSKGICCVLGYQDIGLVRADFGTDEANALCGMPRNQAFFASGSPIQAEWGSLVCGRMERALRLNRSYSFSEVDGEHPHKQKGKSVSLEHVLDQPFVPPMALQSVGRAHPSSGFGAYYRALPVGRPWFERTTMNDGLWKMLVPPREVPTATFHPKGLPEWDKDEREALGLEAAKSGGVSADWLAQFRAELQQQRGPK